MSYKPFFKTTARLFENGNLSVGWNNNMFCCGATASRTAPLNTQTVEHGHNPVVYSQYTQTLGNATLIEVRGGGIYIRDNFTPYSNDFETPGRTDQATGVSSVNGQNASKQFHNRTTIDASIAHSTSAFGPGSHDFKTGVQTAFATQRTVSAQHRRRQLHRSQRRPVPGHLQRPAGHRRPHAVVRAPTSRTPGR